MVTVVEPALVSPTSPLVSGGNTPFTLLIPSTLVDGPEINGSRQFSGPDYSMSRAEASAILGATYGGYAAVADAQLAERCHALLDKASQSLPDPVTLLDVHKVKVRWPAPGHS